MGTIDVRGFRYALEPLLRRQRWRLEAQQARLAALLREIARDADAQRALEEGCAARAGDVARALAGRIDPAGHQRELAYLAQLRGAILAGAERLAEKRRQGEQLRALCIALQRRLDLLEEHRGVAAGLYGQAERNRHSAEMDREWIARGVWRALAEAGVGP